MSHSLIPSNKSLVPKENIENEFMLIVEAHFVGRDRISSKYGYFHHEQREMLRKHDLSALKVMSFFIKHKDKIPIRYHPQKRKIKIRTYYQKAIRSQEFYIADLKWQLKQDNINEREKKELCGDIEAAEEQLKRLEHEQYIYVLVFKIPVISFLTQKDFEDGQQYKIVKFFQEYTQSNGVEFNIFIDNWVRKLLSEDIKVK